jgi:NAD(P)H-dependent flavin oxidoreductase YrpB (nitropropane dioxygenase family)
MTTASHHPALHTAICDLFGVQYPVIQTGMGWVATPHLTAATSNAGGLGVLASGTLTVPETEAAIRATLELTDKVFGVNMRGDAPDVGARAELLIKHGVKIASFALAPQERVIRQLKDAGIVVMSSIGARRHAEKVAAWGVDTIIVQGAEAGGHTGSVPTSILLPQVAAAVDIPVIGAGGFNSGRGLVAALAYGAAGIAMGTRFLLTSDSLVPDSVKAEYLKRTVNEKLIKSNRLALLPRSLRSAAGFKKLSGTSWADIVREGLTMKKSHQLSWAQVIMAANTPMMLKASMVDGRTDLGTLASGQVAGLIDDLPSCAELIGRIMTEAEDVLGRLTAPQPAEEADGNRRVRS